MQCKDQQFSFTVGEISKNTNKLLLQPEPQIKSHLSKIMK